MYVTKSISDPDRVTGFKVEHYDRKGNNIYKYSKTIRKRTLVALAILRSMNAHALAWNRREIQECTMPAKLKNKKTRV